MLASQSKTTGGFNERERTIAWIGFWVNVNRYDSAATMILLNEASVLYTFYAPLQAHVSSISDWHL